MSSWFSESTTSSGMLWWATHTYPCELWLMVATGLYVSIEIWLLVGKRFLHLKFLQWTSSFACMCDTPEFDYCIWYLYMQHLYFVVIYCNHLLIEIIYWVNIGCWREQSSAFKLNIIPAHIFVSMFTSNSIDICWVLLWLSIFVYATLYIFDSSQDYVFRIYFRLIYCMYCFISVYWNANAGGEMSFAF